MSVATGETAKKAAGTGTEGDCRVDNHLVIAGMVSRAPETRRSPAGIPITRFTLQHKSQQMEAGRMREALMSIGVVASGEALAAVATKLEQGSMVRIEGFLTRSSHRHESCRLVLRAQRIELQQALNGPKGHTGDL
jgi:primosomal replication protein N